eukprot:CAMPEP_0182421082 /NCGR_PEP_ID=MMETSP1167-20130531/6303_1 /TAXON_ID=2988 /ORGANISM="Mallomonas Sp, Strain CCMP3275" /LENGTH=56 /DNA_ID=CAMNT_0024597855 /DNA_START=218 /DNA_END=388 /DNA_ORIENTATION=-
MIILVSMASVKNVIGKSIKAESLLSQLVIRSFIQDYISMGRTNVKKLANHIPDVDM